MFETKISTGHYAKHETREKAQAWLDQNIKLHSFGKPERWVLEELFTGDESIVTATIDDEFGESTRQIDGMFGSVTEYHFDAEYTWEIQDITEKYNKAKAIEEKLNNGQKKTVVCEKALHYILGCDLENEDEAFGNIIDLLAKNNMGRSKNLIVKSELIDATVKEDLLSFFPGV